MINVTSSGAARRSWALTAKVALFVGSFLALSLLTVGAMLWVSWNLEGGAAAVNEAGRLRMMSYRLALSSRQDEVALVPVEARNFDRILEELRSGNPARPLSVPWDSRDRALFAQVVAHWRVLRARWLSAQAPPDLADVDAFVAQINTFVMAIEHRLDFWTVTLHELQLALAVLVVLGALLMMYAGHLLVLAPVGQLHRGVAAVERGDFSAQVRIDSADELGDLARGFNRMARHLQSLYEQLEERVRVKTADLKAEQQRLAALYEISGLVSQASTLEDLAEGFVRAARRIADADAAVLRWTDEATRRSVLLSADGLPKPLAEQGRCLYAGNCHCGSASPAHGTSVIQLAESRPQAELICLREGFATMVTLPVTLQQRLLGEVNLFYRAPVELNAAQRSLLDAMAGHLASGMEGLRGVALEREAAVARERTLLARELHDSIAQSLAFLKIQVQLLRSALRAGALDQAKEVTAELDTGVRESLADVRELLLHFRTRTQEADIEPALRGTLQKFELQSGVPARLSYQGHGGPLDPDVQIQVLHVVQEALSNVRKHARAGQVEVTVHGLPAWRFEITDDGCGFDPGRDTAATQVGLQIMRERARAIGALLRLESAPGRGTKVVLELSPDEWVGARLDVG